MYYGPSRSIPRNGGRLMFLPSGSADQVEVVAPELGSGQGIVVIDTILPDDFLLLKSIVESDNPCQYKGRVIYVKTLVSSYPWPDPFLFENKFYFNENCEWFESPFALNGII